MNLTVSTVSYAAPKQLMGLVPHFRISSSP